MQKMSEAVKNYFRRELNILRRTGISLFPHEKIHYKMYSYFCVGVVLGYPFLAFGDLFKHDFDIVADLLVYELATVMVCCEVVVVLWNKKKLKNLLDKLENEPFAMNIERGGEIERKLLVACKKITARQATVCWASVITTVAMATVATLLKRVVSSDYHDWEFTYGPLTVLNVTHSPNFEITWIYQIVSVLLIGMNHCSIVLIMAGILAHISVQFKILQNNLRRIVENAYRLMCGNNAGRIDASIVSWDHLDASLNDAISYHLNILEATAEMKDILNMLTLSIFLFSLGLMCFLVYHASLIPVNSMRFFKAFTDLMSALFPVFLLCFWSHEVANESLRVSTDAFEANFVGADLRFQKNLKMIMVRSQKPVVLKAGGLIEISLPSFVGIMRSSYSAFMVLRNVNNK